MVMVMANMIVVIMRIVIAMLIMLEICMALMMCSDEYDDDDGGGCGGDADKSFAAQKLTKINTALEKKIAQIYLPYLPPFAYLW